MCLSAISDTCYFLYPSVPKEKFVCDYLCIIVTSFYVLVNLNFWHRNHGYTGASDKFCLCKCKAKVRHGQELVIHTRLHYDFVKQAFGFKIESICERNSFDFLM